MREKVLILGGSRWQLGVIRAAQALGLRTVVADISAEAPGGAIADEFVQIDTNDVQGLVEIVRRTKPSLVLAEQTDRLMPIAGHLNDEFKLPGISRIVAERFTNKLAMRNFLDGKGIPMPSYRAVSSVNEVHDAIQALKLPVIVKPLQSQSSMGVSLVTDVSQIVAAYEAARAIGSGSNVLIEEFIDGVEITVEGLSVNGKCTVLAISEKAHYTHRPCVARLLAYPPRFSADVLERIRTTAKKVVETLGLDIGLSHAEYRIRQGVPYLVEVAARGGGNGIASTIVPHVSGIDVYALLIRHLLGESVEVPEVKSRAAILEFFDFAPGHVTAVDGVAECLQGGIAQELHVPYASGDWVLAAMDDRNRPGYFIALGDSRDDVDARAEAIKRRVRIRYDELVRN